MNLWSQREPPKRTPRCSSCRTSRSNSTSTLSHSWRGASLHSDAKCHILYVQLQLLLCDSTPVSHDAKWLMIHCQVSEISVYSSLHSKPLSVYGAVTSEQGSGATRGTIIKITCVDLRGGYRVFEQTVTNTVMKVAIKTSSLYVQCFRSSGGWPPWTLQDWVQVNRPRGNNGHCLGPLPKQTGPPVTHLLCCEYQEVGCSVTWMTLMGSGRILLKMILLLSQVIIKPIINSDCDYLLLLVVIQMC